jgi:hypothetical protein
MAERRHAGRQQGELISRGHAYMITIWCIMHNEAVHWFSPATQRGRPPFTVSFCNEAVCAWLRGGYTSAPTFEQEMLCDQFGRNL